MYCLALQSYYGIRAWLTIRSSLASSVASDACGTVVTTTSVLNQPCKCTGVVKLYVMISGN